MLSCVLLAANAAAANPLPSEELPQPMLEACEERAAPLGRYDRPIAAAVEALTGMGVFEKAEFRGVKIGFCGLREAGGPVATISCARDIILLDSGYAAKDQSLVMSATLAHEMKHYLQHAAQKQKFGPDYCSSGRYAEDKTWMEEKADAFGDEAAALFFTGRGVEIKNECAAPLSVYLEPEHPMSAIGDSLSLTDVAPQSTVALPGRALSKFFKTYAATGGGDGRQTIRGGARAPDKRIIDGKVYGVSPVTLSNASRTDGPFQLSLSCQSDHDPQSD